MEYKEASYSFKVWLTTIIIAPLLVFIGMYISGNFRGNHDFFSLSEVPLTWIIFIAAGGVFSLFTFGLFYMAVKLTVNNVISLTNCKCAISLLGVLLIMATFATISTLIDVPFLEFSSYFAICYYTCAAGFSWFYDLAKPLPAEEPSLIENLNI